tara:strand:+ start:842 stop:1540 length:699 start_codon:yes stop_codon:yes gene_type:complete
MVCCSLVNSSIVKQASIAGDLTIQRGTANHNDRGVINYWYKHSTGIYFIPYGDLTAIPDGATINNIAFEYDLTLAPGGSTYSISNAFGFIYLQSNQGFAQMPSAMLNNGLATSNTNYNNGIINYTDFWNAGSTGVNYSFTQASSDPNQRYVDIPFVNTMTYKAGHSIGIAIINNSGNYTGTGSTPGWLGDTSSGTLRHFFRQQNDTLGPYSVTGSSTASDLTFRPNIRIDWV